MAAASEHDNCKGIDLEFKTAPEFAGGSDYSTTVHPTQKAAWLGAEFDVSMFCKRTALDDVVKLGFELERKGALMLPFLTKVYLQVSWDLGVHHMAEITFHNRLETIELPFTTIKHAELVDKFQTGGRLVVKFLFSFPIESGLVFKEFLGDASSSDTKIVCQGGDVVLANSLLLKASSAALKAAFAPGWQTASSGELHWQTVTARLARDCLLHSIYAGYVIPSSLKESDLDDVMWAYDKAHELGLPVATTIMAYLEDLPVTTENFHTLHLFVKKYETAGRVKKLGERLQESLQGAPGRTLLLALNITPRHDAPNKRKAAEPLDGDEDGSSKAARTS